MAKKTTKQKEEINEEREKIINEIALSPLAAFALGKFIDGSKTFRDAVKVYKNLSKKIDNPTTKELEQVYSNNITPELRAKRNG